QHYLRSSASTLPSTWSAEYPHREDQPNLSPQMWTANSSRTEILANLLLPTCRDRQAFAILAYHLRPHEDTSNLGEREYCPTECAHLPRPQPEKLPTFGSTCREKV